MKKTLRNISRFIFLIHLYGFLGLLPMEQYASGKISEKTRVQKDSITVEEAELMALDLIDRFSTFSQLKGNNGEDYSRDFLSLFSINASIPLDYFEGERSANGSPETYVSEYVASGINKPLVTKTVVMIEKTMVEELQGSDDYSVTVFVKRNKTRIIVNNEYIALTKPQQETWKIIVTAYGYGDAQIYQINKLIIPRISPLAFDIDFGFNAANADISSIGEGVSIVGLDEMKVSSKNIALGINYRFVPFRDPTSEEPIKIYMKAGLGIDFTTYSSSELSLSGQIPDYIADDGVYLLINAPDSLNDKPMAEGSGDFILSIEDKFDEEKLKVTTLDLMIGGGYQLRESTAVELGLGMVGSSSGEIAVRSDYSRYATFAEGFFEDNPVTIYPGSAAYALQIDPIMFDDQDNIYGFGNSIEETNYKAETQSSLYLELKLIQMFDVRDFSIGGTASFRTLLGSPISQFSEGSSSLQEVGLNGMPRLIAFTEKFNPFYIGFGIRIQKR